MIIMMIIIIVIIIIIIMIIILIIIIIMIIITIKIYLLHPFLQWLFVNVKIYQCITVNTKNMTKGLKTGSNSKTKVKAR